MGIGGFSLKCRKTKTKVISPANHNRQSETDNLMNQSKLEANTCEQATIGFASDWFEKVARNFISQSQSVPMQNRSNRENNFRHSNLV